MTITSSPRSKGSFDQPSHTVEILADRCAGCQECYVRCPTGAIGFDETNWIVTANDELCVGCYQCERTCPFSAIFVHGEPQTTPSHRHEIAHVAIPGVQPWEETRLGFASIDEVMAEAARCLECPDPTCVRGCPAHNNIPALMHSVVEGNLDQARSIFEDTTHLGSICSRVCNQGAQCEGACSWVLAGAEAVAIGLVERYVFDNSEIHTPLPVDRSAARSVAVVGSGPAAMAACWELVGGGASVTVYEAHSEPGGLLNHGIPEFTLPVAKVIEQWRTLQNLGVDLKLSHRVNPQELEALSQDNTAVILAHGAGSPIKPPIEGMETGRVSDAMDFLSFTGEALLKMEELPGLKDKTILVVGAGNTAMDVGRMAIRFGAKPICVEWVAERFGKVRSDELAEARAEGVEVKFLHTASKIDHQIVTLVRTKHHDATKLPVVIADTEEEIRADYVVLALGYRLTKEFGDLAPQNPLRADPASFVDRTWLGSGIFHQSHNSAIGPLSWSREQTTHAARRPFAKNIYVVGDALVGPSTVVEAMAQGREAARSVLARIPDGAMA